MDPDATFRHVPYSGYPQRLKTLSGTPLTAVLDATRPGAFRRLWGMTLLERSLRTIERLGGEDIHILVRPEDEARARRRRFPSTSSPETHVVSASVAEALGRLLAVRSGPVMLLEGDALYDRRLLAALWQSPTPAVGVWHGESMEAPAAVAEAAWLRELGLDEADGPEAVSRACLNTPEARRVDLDSIETRVSLLRKSVPVHVLHVGSDAEEKRADEHLKALAGKGVNDLIGEYVHPPIEFLLTRLTAQTPITPDQISYVIILLSLAGVWLFATGRLWEGIAVNLVRGVLDGVDGKLARLTLRESPRGNVLDHGTDTAYLPLLFLALGWHLSGGQATSPPAVASYLLQAFYWMNRILASWFKRFLGADESEFRPIDRVVRRVQPKRNIFMLMMICAMAIGTPVAGLYGITALTGVFMVYRLARLEWEGRRLGR